MCMVIISEGMTFDEDEIWKLSSKVQKEPVVINENYKEENGQTSTPQQESSL